MIKLDSWQKEAIDTFFNNETGNIAVRAGRQVGKSTAISILAGRFAVENMNKSILIVAAVERQAQLLFEKVYSYLFDNHKSLIRQGLDRPTKHTIRLKNGSIIRCLPTGLTGAGVRGYTTNLLICDEAAFIPDDVFSAITPQLAVTKGRIVLLSTPFGREGYFYRAFKDESFSTFHVSSLDCPRRDDNFLEQEKKRMSKMQFAQEYLGEFIDELRQFFPSDLIRRSMTLEAGLLPLSQPQGDFFCGVDIAARGEDQTVIITLKRANKEWFLMAGLEITERTYLTQTIDQVKELDKNFKYRKIYIDDGGIGLGVHDALLFDSQTKNKVIGINNASRSISPDEKRKKKILKEDLYNNLLYLMETRKIDLWESPELYQSLASVQYEYTDKGELRIFGRNTHCAEALIRAAWSYRDKSLSLWAASV